MFYVLYSPSHKQYLDQDRDLCKYENAEQFRNCDGVVADKILELTKDYISDVKWVGPCEEGKEP